MTTTSYAERARRFLAERAAIPNTERERSEGSEESRGPAALLSHLSLSSRPEPDGGVSATVATGGERSEESEESPVLGALVRTDRAVREKSEGCEERAATARSESAAVWWDDRGAEAPVRHAPPRGCLGPRVCARLGPCDRHAAGRPCLVEIPNGGDDA